MNPATEQQYRDRIDELEEQVRQLHAVINNKDVHFPAAWGLTPGETRALRCLYSAGTRPRSKEAIRIAISKSEMTGYSMVQTVVCRLRQKVKPHGVEIPVNKGEGYYLTQEGMAVLKTNAMVPQVAV